MSTVALLLGGCTVHVGVLPTDGAWAVGSVAAPVAEPDVDAWVREALTTALGARGALDPDGRAIAVTITDASWRPTRRSGDVLLYEARLTVHFSAGDREGTRSRAWTVVDPGDAASARALREDTMRALSRQVVEDAVAWLLAP